MLQPVATRDLICSIDDCCLLLFFLLFHGISWYFMVFHLADVMIVVYCLIFANANRVSFSSATSNLGRVFWLALESERLVSVPG